MNTTTAAVATGSITLLGRWSSGKSLDAKIVIGTVAYAAGLSLLGDNALTQRLSLMVLIVACFMYLPTVAAKVGLIKQAPQWR